MSELTHERERGRDLTHIVQMALRIYKGLYAHSKGLGGIREIVTEVIEQRTSANMCRRYVSFSRMCKRQLIFIISNIRHVLNGHCLKHLGKRPPDEVGLKIA